MRNLTEIVFILDRSGSMSGLESDTIGGFNALINKQKKETGEALISTVLFNDTIEVLHDRLLLEEIQPITEKDYCAFGCTALLDAVGGAINHIGNIHKYARPEDVPQRTLFVITTDGLENSSCYYSYHQIKKMIERQEKRFGWEFLFLGANIDSKEMANRVGIRAERATNYHSDKEGTALNYEVISETICQVRANQPIDKNWKVRIDKDYKRRR